MKWTGKSRSSPSHSTRKSMHSNASKSSDVAIEAATLMSKLKFMDLEAKSKVELERTETLKKPEVARVKLDILDSDPTSDTRLSSFNILPKDGMNELPNTYVESCHSSASEQKLEFPPPETPPPHTHTLYMLTVGSTHGHGYTHHTGDKTA